MIFIDRTLVIRISSFDIDDLSVLKRKKQTKESHSHSLYISYVICS